MLGGGVLGARLTDSLAPPPPLPLPLHPPGTPGVGLKLADMGCAFGLTETDTSAVFCDVQTLPYRAPEVGGLGCVAGVL